MPFQKGNRANPSGRPKGAANKETKKIRDWIGKLLDNNMDKVEDDLSKLEPKDRINSILSLLEYSVPKLARTELVNEEGQGFTINVITHSQSKNDSE